MNLVNDKKLKKIAGQPSWITPEVIACYENGNKQARLTYGMIGENIDLWGVEVVNIADKKLIKATAFGNANNALNWLKKVLK